MKHRIVVAVAIGAGLSAWLLALAGGYFVDPALTPLFLFYPLLTLLLAATSFLVTICYGLGILVVARTKRNICLALLALIGPVTVVAGPRMFSDYDAFVYRMKSFSEVEYRRLAEDMKAQVDARGIRLLSSREPTSGESSEIPRSLIDSHPILAISNFPLQILARDESMSLRWGSGLTGGYTVAISLSADPPTEWADDLRQGDYNLPVTYIYDGVAAARLP